MIGVNQTLAGTVATNWGLTSEEIAVFWRLLETDVESRESSDLWGKASEHTHLAIRDYEKKTLHS